jgi:hypothetical protein
VDGGGMALPDRVKGVPSGLQGGVGGSAQNKSPKLQQINEGFTKLKCF